jgi:hypothetical protein
MEVRLKMSKKKIVILMVFICLVPIGLVSTQQYVDRIDIASARSTALGGLHAALTDDLYSLFNNPAGFQSLERELRVAEMTLGLSGPIFDIAGLIIEGIGGADIAALLLDPEVQDLLNGLYAGMNLVGPISFGYVGGGLGVGIVSWVDMSFKSVGSLTLETRMRESFVINGGYSFRIPFPEESKCTLDFGLLLKALLMTEVQTTRSVVDLVTLMGNPAALIFGEPFKMTIGVGADVGMKFAYSNWFALGIVVRDLYSPMSINEYASLNDFLSSGTAVRSNGTIPLDLSAGVLFTPRFGRVERYISNFKLVLDYNDILEFVFRSATAKNWVLHLGIGAEAELLNILSIRMGFNEGLFAAGLGLDLGFMHFDASMYGSELSSEPGMHPIYNLIFGVSFNL